MDVPRVPVQFVNRSDKMQAALRFAAGAAAGGTLSSGLSYLCEQLSILSASPIASVYVLEAQDELVLRGNHGFAPDAIGEVRMKVGQGITGTCVEALTPVSVDDARLFEQFEYFPQLAEERYPAFLAVPLLSGGRPRGALVLQRESGPFSEGDALVAVAASRGITQLIESQRPQGAHLLLHGEGNRHGRALGAATLLSRALPRRDPRKAPEVPLADAFKSIREEASSLAQKARGALKQPCPALEEVCLTLEDGRIEERALEHASQGVPPALALERVAAEVARALFQQGPAARRAVDVEAFLGAVAHRLSGIEPQRVRRGELLVSVHLPGFAALRAWAAGATGAVCTTPAGDSTGASIFSALGVPAVSGVRQIFESATQGDRIALDSDSGEVLVNPSASQTAAWRAQ